MSGFVVAYGNSQPEEVKSMFERISHRGPFAEGLFEGEKIIMAQNYFRADGISIEDGNEIPVVSALNKNVRICYDGQVGNWNKLAAERNISDDPCKEERLLLDMYSELGLEMLGHLGDAIFSFVISEGENFIAARDLLGIKPLFYGLKNGNIYFSSELKSIVQVTDDVYEFPPGHYMINDWNPIPYAKLPEEPPANLHSNVHQMIENVRGIIQRSFNSRVDFSEPTGSLLSGGLDSSVIATLATKANKEKSGNNAKLKTFALGIGESGDIHSARVMSNFLGTEHHELIVDLDQILEVLPDVIYHLESFDPSLVRSSVSNYLISRYSKEQGIDVLLSGEGGDEVFCGYLYLKDYPPEQLFAEQIKVLKALHNNASLRLDRMNMCNSVRVVAPLISGELLNYALAIAPEYKQRSVGDGKVEKWIFRKAFEEDLPNEIVWRLKQEFSQGSGSADVLPPHFDNIIGDKELEDAKALYPKIRSKEELYYFRIFRQHFSAPKAADTVGQWVSL